MRKLLIFLLLLLPLVGSTWALPPNFIYLRQIDPTILQDIRYAGQHNLVGRQVAGYAAGQCILTKATAARLAQVQQYLRPWGLSLKVYDCYRPVVAVNDFYRWSQDRNTQQMKAEFFPRENKAYLFAAGYIAEKSGHSRGSTVDLTLVDLHHTQQARFNLRHPLIACYAPYRERFRDNSIDMGTGFDCLDRTARYNTQEIDKNAQTNRLALRHVMQQYGFIPYNQEWWHFTLQEEPYPNTYFSFFVK